MASPSQMWMMMALGNAREEDFQGKVAQQWWVGSLLDAKLTQTQTQVCTSPARPQQYLSTVHARCEPMLIATHKSVKSDKCQPHYRVPVCVCTHIMCP